MAEYSKNSGSSIEDAIVITGVANHSAGVQAEYDYVIKQHGQARMGWTMQRQALLHRDKRAFDCLEIVLRDGSPKTYYFDISAFFGHIDEELQLAPQPSLLQQIFRSFRRLFGGSERL